MDAELAVAMVGTHCLKHGDGNSLPVANSVVEGGATEMVFWGAIDTRPGLIEEVVEDCGVSVGRCQVQRGSGVEVCACMCVNGAHLARKVTQTHTATHTSLSMRIQSGKARAS